MSPLVKRIAGLYVAWLVAAVLLVLAATERHPYNFYTVLRWVCCAVFVYSAFTAHEKNRGAWTWIFGALAALYNPIFHVHLDRSTWATVNWLTVAAIAVATAFFWPRDKESTVSLFDTLEILPVSRPAVAREWLIFLAVLPLGFATCFFLGFYRGEPSSLSGAYDDFWNAHFGLGRVPSLALWLAPYLAVTLIRSIIWSISTLWPGRNLKREAFYSFLAVYLIAVVWVGTVAIAELNKARTLRETLDNNVPESATAQEILRGISQTRQLGYSDNDIYNSLIQKFNGFIVSRELKGLGYRIATNDGSTLAGLERALSKDAFGVQPDDLRKIILFDVAPYYAEGWRSWSCNGFHGRVRNDLSRPVRNLVLKAVFYGAQGELIEVKTFVLQNAAFEPGTPASFDERFSVDHLPQGYRYILEVIQAAYVPWF